MAGHRPGLARLGRVRVLGRHLIRRGLGLDLVRDRTRPGRRLDPDLTRRDHPLGRARDRGPGRILLGRLRRRPVGGAAGGMWIRLPLP
jgi:hypothetical protein